MKIKAIWKDCPSLNNNHSLQDSCSDCSPYWERYPVCPRETGIDKPLPKSGWCKKCRQFHDVILETTSLQKEEA